MDNVVLLPALVEVGLVTARSVKQRDRVPLPSEFVAVFVVFGGCAIAASWDRRLGAALGWGIVAATFLNVMPFISSGRSGGNPGNSPAGLNGNRNPNPGLRPATGAF